jgi:DNA-binding IclR family transcriptional regulator
MAKGIMIQSVERAVLMLGLFSEDNSELKLQEICERMNLNKSTAHGILHTLKYHGLIAQNEENQRYRLGLNLIELAYRVQKGIDLREAAAPILKGISKRAWEFVNLGILDGHDVVYIDKSESTQAIRISTSVGSRNPAHSSAVGRAILAFLPEEEQPDHLPEVLIRSTPKTKICREEIIKELRLTKARGYSVLDGEFLNGILTVGAPIFNYENKAVGAISIAGPKLRITEERITEMAGIVCQAAEKISEKLGYMILRKK